MEIGTKDNLKTIKCMVRVYILGMMAPAIKESTYRVSKMALEFLPLLMEVSILANG